MRIITLDFETFYDRDYSLSKITTEEYIRDPRFEVIGVGVKDGGNPVEWFSGDALRTKLFLEEFDWANSAMLAHNTMFDGAILNWRFGIKPKAYFDTMCMARAKFGVETSASLKAVSDRMGVGQKGDEVIKAMGMRRADFSDAQLHRYGQYCEQDVNLTAEIFSKMMQDGFPVKELKLIDLTLRMFTDPVLELDGPLLEEHLHNVVQAKENALLATGLTREDLMSNNKFAEVLETYGVTPPTKISPTTGRETYAFAKTDPGLKDLLEHDNDMVQALVSARMGVKSTLEETRTERFLEISKRGPLPIPLRYYAAHTGRWGGADKVNLQNLPSRGPNAKTLKRAIKAPKGHVLVEADSSQIEARILAWLAGQHDLVHAFSVGDDVYKHMASRIYGVDVEDVTKEQRFVGKTTILGCGYGMGPAKFQAQLKNFGVEVELEEAQRIIRIYRDTNDRIAQLWRDAHTSIKYLVRDNCVDFGRPGVLYTVLGGIQLPSGLVIRYDDLRANVDEEGREQYSYKTRNGRTKLYGGKVTENVTQALARCVIGEQMLAIKRRYRPVLTVHDSIVCCVPEDEALHAKAYVEQCMRWVPEWAEGLPVDCEAGVGPNYGETE